MLTLVIRNNLEIQGADKELQEYLRALLTILNPAWVNAEAFGRWTGDLPKHLYQFSEKNGSLFVPRGMLDHILCDLGREWKVVDGRTAREASIAWPEGNVILRPNDQEPAVQEVLEHENGFLSAPAGSGKTIMGLEICRRLGLKALWLTHRKELRDQAVEEAVEHFELLEEKIGVIQGKRWTIGDQLTVGMIPTLNKRDLSTILSEFGVIVIDEAHHTPSSTFLNVVGQFNAKYIYGLTATAYRQDKLEAVMFNAIGPKLAEIGHVELVEDEHLMQPTIRRRCTGWCPKNASLMGYHDLMEAMVSAPDRNDQIVEDVISECKLGNLCIVLVARTKHAEILTELLKNKSLNCEFVVSSVDVEDTGEGKKKRKRKRAIPNKVREKIISDFKTGQLQVLVTTYDLLKEGFNYRPLNRLFMATPVRWRGSVVQALGRIQRTSEGKDDAIAYDYIDDCIPMFINQAESRLSIVYKGMGMNVEGP